jgi:hypothetical protein
VRAPDKSLKRGPEARMIPQCDGSGDAADSNSKMYVSDGSDDEGSKGGEVAPIKVVEPRRAEDYAAPPASYVPPLLLSTTTKYADDDECDTCLYLPNDDSDAFAATDRDRLLSGLAATPVKSLKTITADAKIDTRGIDKDELIKLIINSDANLTDTDLQLAQSEEDGISRIRCNRVQGGKPVTDIANAVREIARGSHSIVFSTEHTALRFSVAITSAVLSDVIERVASHHLDTRDRPLRWDVHPQQTDGEIWVLGTYDDASDPFDAEDESGGGAQPSSMLATVPVRA